VEQGTGEEEEKGKDEVEEEITEWEGKEIRREEGNGRGGGTNGERRRKVHKRGRRTKGEKD
jgi:hypothetical protein